MKKNRKKTAKEKKNKVTASEFFNVQYDVLKELFGKFKLETVLVLILSCSLVMTDFIGLKFTEYSTNSVSAYLSGSYHKPFSTLVITISLFIAAILFSKIVEWIYNRINAKYKEDVAYEIEKNFVNKLSSIPYEYFENNAFHEKLNMARTAGSQYSQAIYGISRIFSILITLVVYGFLLSKLNLKFILVIGASIVISIWLSGIVTDKQLDFWRYNVSPDNRKCNYFSGILSNRVNQQDIQTNRLFPFFGRKYELYNKKDMKNCLTLNMLSFTTEIASSLLFIAVYIIAIIYVGKKVVDGTVQIGYFTMVSLLLFNLFSSMKGFSYFLLDGNWYVKILSSYYDIMNIKEKYGSNGVIGAPDKFDIEICDLKYKYPQAEAYALNGISCHFKSGEKIAIVGHNGSGKSTLMGVLMGLLNTRGGMIKVSGGGDMETLQANTTAILQDFGQYQMTIKENIEIGNSGRKMEDAQIREILRKVELLDIVDKMEKGINTPLGQLDKGIELSKGQWQRLAIARLLANQSAKIWVLDEPTAYLDPLSEIQMYKFIFSLAGSRLVFFISHRLGFAKNADRILVIQNGKIAEQGAHRELIQIKNGIYKHMYEAQMQWYA